MDRPSPALQDVRVHAWLAAALPAAGVVIGFVLARTSGDLAPMWPPVDGEVSISRAMRHEPAVQVFRAFTMPAAVFMALSWIGVAGRLGPRAGLAARALGVAGAVFLVLYASYLGSDGAMYRALRRWGVYVFFGGTGLAHLLAAWAWVKAGPPPFALRVYRVLTLLMVAAGPVQVIADRIVAPDDDRIANILEWWIGAGLVGGFACLARLVSAPAPRDA